MGNLVNQATIKYRSAIESAQANIDRINSQISGIDNQVTQINSQIQSITAEIAQHAKLAAEYQRNWDTRYNCGGFKQACNNWLDKRNAENNIITNLKTQLANYEQQIQALLVQKNGLNAQLRQATDTLNGLQAESDRAIAEAAAQENAQVAAATQAQNATNPVYLATQAQIEIEKQQAAANKVIEIEKAKINAEIEAKKAEASAAEKKSNTVIYVVIGVCVVAVTVVVAILLRK